MTPERIEAEDIEAFLRRKYTVRRSPRSDVVGRELHYMEAEVSDLAEELARWLAAKRDVVVTEEQIERAARALAPIAWAALNVGDTLAQSSRRTASLRHARDALTAALQPGAE